MGSKVFMSTQYNTYCLGIEKMMDAFVVEEISCYVYTSPFPFPHLEQKAAYSLEREGDPGTRM